LRANYPNLAGKQSFRRRRILQQLIPTTCGFAHCAPCLKRIHFRWSLIFHINRGKIP
jgi:hypothetical protein